MLTGGRAKDFQVDRISASAFPKRAGKGEGGGILEIRGGLLGAVSLQISGVGRGGGTDSSGTTAFQRQFHFSGGGQCPLIGRRGRGFHAKIVRRRRMPELAPSPRPKTIWHEGMGGARPVRPGRTKKKPTGVFVGGDFILQRLAHWPCRKTWPIPGK